MIGVLTNILDHLGIELLPSLLNPTKEPITACLVPLMVPFLMVLLDQSLMVELECQLRVDCLLGAILLEWNRGFEDVFLCQVEMHCLRRR
jgi:hypothetical protein